MAEVTLSLTAEQAEEILIALSLRAVQVGRSEGENARTDVIGIRLSQAFEQVYTWEVGVYAAHRKNDVKMKVLTPKVSYK